jgi:hypothetical protein
VWTFPTTYTLMGKAAMALKRIIKVGTVDMDLEMV